MMDQIDNHELIQDLTESWSIEMLERYITRLNERKESINRTITIVRGIIRKKNKERKKPLDTGARSGT